MKTLILTREKATSDLYAQRQLFLEAFPRFFDNQAIFVAKVTKKEQDLGKKNQKNVAEILRCATAYVLRCATDNCLSAAEVFPL